MHTGIPERGTVEEFGDFTEKCCGQIDPTQAVKVTGFNRREHRVFKSILRVPLCPLLLYFLLMSFISVAVLCIQLTITDFTEKLDCIPNGYGGLVLAYLK